MLGAYGGQKQMSDPLRQELQVVVSSHVREGSELNPGVHSRLGGGAATALAAFIWMNGLSSVSMLRRSGWVSPKVRNFR